MATSPGTLVSGHIKYFEEFTVKNSRTDEASRVPDFHDHRRDFIINDFANALEPHPLMQMENTRSIFINVAAGLGELLADMTSAFRALPCCIEIPISVNVRLVDNEADVTLLVSQKATIKELREQLSEHMGTYMRAHFSFNGARLDVNRTLADYHIHNGSILDAVVQ